MTHDHDEGGHNCKIIRKVTGCNFSIISQLTWFKCGGISVGLSWAHVLGDAFSASCFLNTWGHVMAGRAPPKSLHVPGVGKPESKALDAGPKQVSSLRRIDPVGDHWMTANDCSMRTSSVHIAGDHVDRLMASHGKCSRFHILAAMIWKALAKIRGEGRAKAVTICTWSHQGEVDDQCLPGNRMVVGTVEADFLISEAEVSELATWMAAQEANENHEIEGMVGGDIEKSDYILYGANLTFVNLEDANVYALELNGQKPIYANYTIRGAGDEGVILVHPWRGTGPEEEGNGSKVMITLPENEVPELKKELRTSLRSL